MISILQHKTHKHGVYLEIESKYKNNAFVVNNVVKLYVLIVLYNIKK